jgi:hypothetical protein
LTQHHSGMGLMSPERFFVNRRFSEVKLLRFDSRLLEASENVLTAVSGRLGGAAIGAELGTGLSVGDMAPYRPEIDPLGVLRALLGNNPNWACGERDGIATGEATEAPDTEEYAESFPVNSGLCSPFSVLFENRFGTCANVSSALLFDRFRRCPKPRFVRLESTCGAALPRWPSLCQVSW